MIEGWYWPANLRKAHYFVNFKSLCGRYMCFNKTDLEQGKDDSPDNCAECKRRLKKRKEKEK